MLEKLHEELAHLRRELAKRIDYNLDIPEYLLDRKQQLEFAIGGLVHDK